MAIRVNLNYTLVPYDPGVSELTFSMPTSAVLNEKTRFLYASSPNTGPIILTSGDTSKAVVTLIHSAYYVEFIGTGNVVFTATQGSDTKNVTVNISSKAAPTGRTFDVGTPGVNNTLTIDGTDTSAFPGGLQAGDLVRIAPGRYKDVNIFDIVIAGNNIENPVVICNGNGLVYTVNGPWNFENLRNVFFDGSRATGIKYGFLSRDNGYMHSYWREDINYVTLTNFEFRNNSNASMRWEYTGVREYSSSNLNTCYVGNRFLNLKMDGSGALGFNGNIDNADTAKIRALNVDLRFENIEISNCSAGTPIYVGAGQDVVFKNIFLDNINPLNNNHNGVFFCSGTADVINCMCRNFEGNLIRLWAWTLIDGNINGRTTPKTCLFYGNIAFYSRKYGMFEGQSFERYAIDGVTTYANIDIFHNTGGEMNKNNDPVVFTGTLYDNYSLQGGTARVFNNVLINPVNPGSNNVVLTYSSAAVGGAEQQTGTMQEFCNVVYSDASTGLIDPATLCPKIGSTAKTGAKLTDTVANTNFTTDIYGNVSKKWKGAVQTEPMQLPTGLAAPLAPDISQWSDDYADDNANAFMVTAYNAFSPIGVKSYMMKRKFNSDTTTTTELRTGNPRDGRPDPEVDTSWLSTDIIQWAWAGKDWTDQVGPYSTRIVHKMNGVALGTSSSITLTKTSGGTLTGTPGGTYEATGSTVYCSTGIVLTKGQSARIMFDNHNVDPNKFTLPYIGWAETSSITSLTQMRAGVTSNQAGTGDNYQLLVTDGVTRKTEYLNNDDIPCLYVHYDGYSWYDVYRDGIWRDTSSVPRRTSLQLASIAPTTISKYLVVVIPVGTQVKNLRIAYYPTINDL